MSAPVSNNRPYALVVDDDVFIRLDARDMLEEQGFETLEARDFSSALAKLEQHWQVIALVFTDVQMTGRRDGFDLASTVSWRWPHIGIVVVSGHTTPVAGDLPERARFVRKPFSAEAVREQVSAVLNEAN